MEVFIAIIVFIIIGAIISSISKSAERSSRTRQYFKAIDNSTGLEKIRLSTRKDSIMFGNLFQHENDNGVFLLTPMIEAQTIIADIFYGQIQEMVSKVKPELDQTLEKNINENGGTFTVSARIFAIAFGIMLKKAADEKNKEVNQTKVKEYINTSKLSESYKKEISKYTIITLKHLYGIFADSPMGSHEMSELADGLLCLKRKKEDFSDPTYTMALSLAMKVCYGKMTPGSEMIQKYGLLK